MKPEDQRDERRQHGHVDPVETGQRGAGHFVPAAEQPDQFSRFGERVIRERTILLGEGLVGTSAQLREPVLAPDVRKDSRYIEANPEVRSELAVPLVYKGEVIGVLDLEHTRVNYYNDDHQRTLSTLASQVAISIANARLYQRIHEEEQRMERDLEMARQVQLRLMPPSPPAFQRAMRNASSPGPPAITCSGPSSLE